MNDLLNRVRIVFDKSSLSQSEIARKLNVTPAYIWKLLNKSDATPSGRLISDLSEQFDISKEWLLTGHGEMHVTLSDDEQIAAFVGKVLKSGDESFKKRYIKMLSALDDDGWEALEKVAATIQQLKKD